MAAAAARRDLGRFLLIPVAESFLGAGKVTHVDPVGMAVGVGQLDGARDHLVEILDGVLEQLDDVLAAVGKGARVLL